MKVVYILRSVSHFSYHRSTIRSLLKRKKIVVKILFDKKWSKRRSERSIKEFIKRRRNCSFDWFYSGDDFRKETIFFIRELLSYISYLGRNNSPDFYLKRWESYLPIPIQYLCRFDLFKKFLASKLIVTLLKTVERLIPPERFVIDFLRKEEADVVVASPVNMRFSEEEEYIKAAKKMSIPTVIPIHSWDNLTTKGTFHTLPDIFCVWNKTQCQEAKVIHKIPVSNISITGSPFFDKWFERPKLVFDREILYKKLRLNQGESYLLYLGSSANIVRDESWLVERIANFLLDSKDKKLSKIQIIVRPHGANQEVYRKLKLSNIKVIYRKEELPDTVKSFAWFYSLMKYSICILGINTTAMIDAVLAKKPVIALTFSEYQNTNALQAIHFRYLLKANIYYKVDTLNCLKETLSKLIDGKVKRKQIKPFIEDYIRPRGLSKSAGSVTAKVIINMAKLNKAGRDGNSLWQWW